MSKVTKIEVKVNPLLLAQEAEIKDIVPKFYEAFKKDLKGFDVEGATKEIILDNVPTESVLINYACSWNNPFAIGKRVMIVATINNKFAFVEMEGVKLPQIYRLEDLGTF
jgi:hypothetical protein